MRNYDFCVIGGGISGLYFAKRLKEKYPNSSCIILEKENRFGGRLKNSKLNGVDIMEGAGIGRKNKDKRLLSLVEELNIETKSYDSMIDYASTLSISNRIEGVKEFKNLLRELKDQIRKTKFDSNSRSKQDFMHFTQDILGKEKYKRFIDLSGYTDYKKADVVDTIYQYGFDDNYCEPGLKDTIVIIPWEELIKKLVEKNKELGIILKKGSPVVSVKYIEQSNASENNFQVVFKNSSSQSVIHCKKLVFATTIEPLLYLLPRSCMNETIQSQVASQPFMRVYAHIDKKKSKEFTEKINSVTIVPNLLQKIIPMRKKRGVYMVAYSDNENATKLQQTLSKESLEKYIRDALSIKEISIKTFKAFYWKEGTHYFLPLSPEFKNRQSFIDKTLHPCKNVFILGEGFSNNQGWTEGAMERIYQIFENPKNVQKLISYEN